MTRAPGAAQLVLGRALDVALRLSGRHAGLVLVYHALAEEDGDRSRELVPPHGVALFETQLRHLATHYRVVGVEELPRAAAARRRGQRFPVAITFDDDLASHARLAGPILSRRGMPATFFLCGASLERPYSFWWQRLQRAVDLGLEVPVEGRGIHEQAKRIETMSVEERVAVAERLGNELGPEPEDAGLRVAQVRELVAAGFEVGFHTLHHDRLTDLDDAALAAALTEGRAHLEAVVGRPLTAIAYPHGKADRRVAAAAHGAGFRLGFTGRYEPVVTTSESLLLGRIEPTLGSVADFALQLVRALLIRPHR